MSDRVFVRHVDRPDRNGYVSRTAYENLWSKKGYVIEGDEHTDVSVDVTGDVEPGVTADDVATAFNQAATPVPSQDDLNAQLDEKDQLRRKLEALGVDVDGRWGLKRLRAEVAALAAAEPTCSVCDAPAVHEIEGAPEEKGNLACELHRGMWPLSQARPLSPEAAT